MKFTKCNIFCSKHSILFLHYIYYMINLLLPFILIIIYNPLFLLPVFLHSIFYVTIFRLYNTHINLHSLLKQYNKRNLELEFSQYFCYLQIKYYDIYMYLLFFDVQIYIFLISHFIF